MFSEVYNQYHMMASAKLDSLSDTWVPTLNLYPLHQDRRAVFLCWAPSIFASETEAEAFAIQQGKKWVDDQPSRLAKPSTDDLWQPSKLASHLGLDRRK